VQLPALGMGPPVALGHPPLFFTGRWCKNRRREARCKCHSSPWRHCRHRRAWAHLLAPEPWRLLRLPRPAVEDGAAAGFVMAACHVFFNADNMGMSSSHHWCGAPWKHPGKIVLPVQSRKTLICVANSRQWPMIRLACLDEDGTGQSFVLVSGLKSDARPCDFGCNTKGGCRRTLRARWQARSNRDPMRVNALAVAGEDFEGHLDLAVKSGFPPNAASPEARKVSGRVIQQLLRRDASVARAACWGATDAPPMIPGLPEPSREQLCEPRPWTLPSPRASRMSSASWQPALPGSVVLATGPVVADDMEQATNGIGKGTPLPSAQPASVAPKADGHAVSDASSVVGGLPSDSVPDDLDHMMTFAAATPDALNVHVVAKDVLERGPWRTRRTCWHLLVPSVS